MTQSSLDPRFDSRDAEVQYYQDWIDDCQPGWDPAEKKRFARTVVRLKENAVDAGEREAPTA